MAIQYPSYLPGVLLDSYGIQTVEPMQRTQMDSGRARQRRRFTNVPQMVTVGWVFTQQEAALFEAWHRWELKDGAEWFEIELSTPYGYQPYLCRFTRIYQGGKPFAVIDWTHSAELEIKERKTLPVEYLAAQEFVLNSDLFDLAVNQEWPEA